MFWQKALMLFTQLFSPRPEPVRVSGGLVQGQLASDGSFIRYNGIPYATVHTRFQEATPDPKWRGILQATDAKIVCTQRLLAPITDIAVGQEDCLVLNVYAPINRKETLRPVMVFIHGGGFIDGSGAPFLYGPEYLVKHDIILVTLNYRLDILGFLCLGIKEAPGNIGLKDQVLALRWVKKNIKSFGGDPDNVTIFGESAGGSSVSYHLISPLSRGLFKRAIMESGTVLSQWGLQLHPVEYAHKFAKYLGHDTENLHELVNIFKRTSANRLVTTNVPRVPGELAIFNFNFIPCVEREIPGVERFLPDYPYNLLSKGDYSKVPVIMGFNSEEGYLFISLENDTSLATFNFNASLPPDLEFPTESDRQKAAHQLNSLYMNENISSKTKRMVFTQYEGDLTAPVPVSRTIEIMVKISNQPVFGYKFTHSGKLNLAEIISGYAGYPGATHADELGYLFKPIFPTLKSAADIDMINKMTTMWTNFAKYSDPTPTPTSLLPIRWRPVQKRNPEIFVIDNDQSYTELYENDRLKLWRYLYMHFYIILQKSVNYINMSSIFNTRWLN